MMLPKLNLPDWQPRLKQEDGKDYIYDSYRRKWISLTPEEWVRQSFLYYLCSHLDYPASRISVEKRVTVGKINKRFDALIHGKNLEPLMVIEFKAPDVKINQDVMSQVGIYNTEIKAKYLLISNGLQHFCCQVDFETGTIEFLDSIPEYPML